MQDHTASYSKLQTRDPLTTPRLRRSGLKFSVSAAVEGGEGAAEGESVPGRSHSGSFPSPQVALTCPLQHVTLHAACTRGAGPESHNIN